MPIRLQFSINTSRRLRDLSTAVTRVHQPDRQPGRLVLDKDLAGFDKLIFERQSTPSDMNKFRQMPAIGKINSGFFERVCDFVRLSFEEIHSIGHMRRSIVLLQQYFGAFQAELLMTVLHEIVGIGIVVGQIFDRIIGAFDKADFVWLPESGPEDSIDQTNLGLVDIVVSQINRFRHRRGRRNFVGEQQLIETQSEYVVQFDWEPLTNCIRNRRSSDRKPFFRLTAVIASSVFSPCSIRIAASRAADLTGSKRRLPGFLLASSVMLGVPGRQ